MTRAQRLAQIKALQAQGLTRREIATHIGLKPSGVNAILNDPDGSKQRERRKRYQGKCVQCGGPTDGGNGLGKAPLNCKACIQGIPHWARQRSPDRRRRVWVELRKVNREIRLSAAIDVIKTDPDLEPTDRIELMLLAHAPPPGAGGFIYEAGAAA